MKIRPVCLEMLSRVGVHDPNRLMIEKTYNSVVNYLKKHEGELVESDGKSPVRYRVVEFFEAN